MFQKLKILVSLFMTIGMFSACTASSAPLKSVQVTPTNPPTFQTVPITAVDYGYSMPTHLTIQAGLVDIALVNNGSQSHQAQIARLNPGVSTDTLYTTLIRQKNQAAAFSLLTFVGGPDVISPGYGQEALLNLTAGQYVLLCFVVDPDGIAHMNKGMIHFFTVSSASGQEEPPQANGSILMKDFSYTLPSVLTRSTVLTLQVSNQGSEPHELNIVKLASGKSVSDILSFFQAPSGPPPFEEMGGMAALAPGVSGWLKIHLEPGNYAMYSFMPDEKTGKAQLTLGMLASFIVH